MITMKIHLLEPLGVSEENIQRLAQPLIDKGHSFTYYDTKTTDIQELIDRSLDCDIVMIANTPYPNEVLSKLDNLKLINVAFTGYDHVGSLAKEKNIKVCNASGYSNETVSELVLGLTLSLYRHLIQADHTVRNEGGSDGLIGREIHSKTVGIIGTGKIGIATAKLFQAFGAKVIAYNRTPKKDVEVLGIDYVPIETLMKESDIVSLHLALNEDTYHFIDRQKLLLMKKSSVLINCARGPVIDNSALADILNEGRIAGAGIDVFDLEPPLEKNTALLHAKNTLLTPHIAYYSEESMLRRAEIAFSNTLAFLEGRAQNIVIG